MFRWRLVVFAATLPCVCRGGDWKGQCPTVGMLLSPELDLDDVFRGVQQVQGILHRQALRPDVIDGQYSVSGLYRATSTGNMLSLSYNHFMKRGHSKLSFTISELVIPIAISSKEKVVGTMEVLGSLLTILYFCLLPVIYILMYLPSNADLAPVHRVRASLFEIF